MSSNGAVIAAIRGHHRQLSDELNARTTAVLAAAHDDRLAGVREQLYDFYRTEIVPHAAAEEQTLYRAAEEFEATRLLVRGMLAEHKTLIGLVDDLAATGAALEIATLAASAQKLFESHLAKENDLLLPALDEAGVDLEPMLADMHHLIGMG
jgi:iron-sulfur cluster repair protein YtfE (RIC family)